MAKQVWLSTNGKMYETEKAAFEADILWELANLVRNKCPMTEESGEGPEYGTDDITRFIIDCRKEIQDFFGKLDDTTKPEVTSWRDR